MNSAQEKFSSEAARIQKGAGEIREVSLWQGCFSARAMYGYYLAAAAVTLVWLLVMLLVPTLRSAGYAWVTGAVVIGLVCFWLALVTLYHKLAHHYELTSQRLKHRDGILVRTVNRVELIDMDDVVYRQGPIQMLLNVGDISIKSSDVTDPELSLRGIADVRRVSEMIDEARRSERMRRGLHIESI